MLWVAAAGPLANLLMALGWAVMLKLSIEIPANEFSSPMQFMGEAGITVNVVLMVLNLLPILPLDGGRIVESLLPMRAALAFSRLEPWGFPILLLLIFTNILGPIMHPMIALSLSLIGGLFQF